MEKNVFYITFFFDLLLNIASAFSVPVENMPQTLFIFTDMQFNEAHRGNNTDTLFKHIGQKYEKIGYKMPKLVFWNLRASKSDAFPITMDENGFAYLSGFSAELLKVFMQGVDFNPSSILKALLSRYEVIIDDTERNFSFDTKKNTQETDDDIK
jgi:hypothetical protein